MDAEEAMLAGHRRPAPFPILKDRTDIADVGRNSSDRAKEQVIVWPLLRSRVKRPLAAEIDGIIFLRTLSSGVSWPAEHAR
jgi:hypothetical protein